MVPPLELYSLYTDPAQRLITLDTGSTVDDLDDLENDLSDVDYLDRDLPEV